MKKIIMGLFLVLTVCAFAYGAYEVALQTAYGNIEKLTNQYSSAMMAPITSAYDKQITTKGEVIVQISLDYFKVLDVNDDTAKVLIVDYMKTIYKNGKESTQQERWIRYLKRQNGEWLFDETKSIEVAEHIWPPYR